MSDHGHGHDDHAAPAAAGHDDHGKEAKAEFVESVLGEQLEGVVEGALKRKASVDDIVGRMFRALQPFLKNKTINNLVANAVAYFVFKSKFLDPKTRQVIGVAIRHMLLGAGEAAAELTPDQIMVKAKESFAHAVAANDDHEEFGDDTFIVFVGLDGVGHWAPKGHTTCSVALARKKDRERGLARQVEQAVLVTPPAAPQGNNQKGGNQRQQKGQQVAQVVRNLVDEPLEFIKGTAAELAQTCEGGLCDVCTPHKYTIFVPKRMKMLQQLGIKPPEPPAPSAAAADKHDDYGHASGDHDHKPSAKGTAGGVIQQVLTMARDVLKEVKTLFLTDKGELNQIDVELAELEVRIQAAKAAEAAKTAESAPTAAH